MRLKLEKFGLEFGETFAFYANSIHEDEED